MNHLLLLSSNRPNEIREVRWGRSFSGVSSRVLSPIDEGVAVAQMLVVEKRSRGLYHKNILGEFLALFALSNEAECVTKCGPDDTTISSYFWMVK